MNESPESPKSDHGTATNEIPDGIVRGLADLPEETIITRQALADILGCSTMTIMRMERRGELPPSVRWNGKAAFKIKTILAHFDRRAEIAQREAEKAAAKFLKLST